MSAVCFQIQLLSLAMRAQYKQNSNQYSYWKNHSFSACMDITCKSTPIYMYGSHARNGRQSCNGLKVYMLTSVHYTLV